MAESLTIARPYAQAVFRLAHESGSLAAWSRRLQRLALVAADPRMIALAGDPRFSPGEVAAHFLSLSDEPDNAELKSLLELLATNERLPVLPQICETFEVLRSGAEGIREALVASAFALDEAQLAELLPRLEAHFGGRLKPRVEVDPSLIGGIRVAVGDQVLDASVAGKLEAMALALMS